MIASKGGSRKQENCFNKCDENQFLTMANGVYNTNRWRWRAVFNRALSHILKGKESYYDLVIPSSVERRKFDKKDDDFVSRYMGE